MIGQTTELLFQLLRCGIVLVLAALVAKTVLTATKAKPATEVFGWLLVLLPGWLLLSFTLEIPWLAPVTQPTASLPSLLEIDVDLPYQDLSGLATESQVTSAPVVWTVAEGGIVGLAVIWLVGMLALVVRYAYQYVQMTATVRWLPPLDDPRWQAELEAICDQKAIDSIPKLVVSDLWGPALCFAGWRYFLIVPRAVANDGTADQRAAILQHEITHLERGDLWLAMLGRLLMLPQWFNPAAWYAVSRLGESIEMSCDARVLATSKLDRFVYIKSLLALVELQHETGQHLHSLATTGPPIKKRIQYLVHPKGIEMKFARTLVISALVSIAMMAFLRFELVAQTAVKELPADKPIPTQQAIPAAEELENENSESIEEVCLVETYNVRELFLSVDWQCDDAAVPQRKEPAGGITVDDFRCLIDLIQNTIESDIWGKQQNSITPYPQKLSLVISCPENTHHLIQSLLLKLRGLNIVTVHLEYEVWVVAKTAEPEFGQAHAAVDDEQFEKIKAEKPYQIIESRKYPMVHGFNGSAFRAWPLSLNDVEVSGFRMQVIHTSDRSAVNLLVNKFIAEDASPPTYKNYKETSKRIANDMEGLSATEISNKGYAEIDVSKLIENNKDDWKAVLLVRPTIIVDQDRLRQQKKEWKILEEKAKKLKKN